MRAKDQQRATDLLFDAIGQIEDRFVAEAATPYVRAGKGLRLRRSLILALTLSLVLVSSLGLLIAQQVTDKEDHAVEMETGDILNDEATGTVGSLSDRLSALRAETASLRVPREELDLFSGKAQVIWKFSDESGYRVKQVSRSEQTELTRMMTRDPGRSLSTTESADPGELEGIWIALGDGTVISPCLRQAPGNTAYGTLFSYEPELEPSVAFADTLCGIIS
ncbi:MAG: hypothetical protein IJY47_05460 [Clostridia bacterium]|nr:hypothetical protein [Clostridia bacterium]